MTAESSCGELVLFSALVECLKGLMVLQTSGFHSQMIMWACVRVILVGVCQKQGRSESSSAECFFSCISEAVEEFFGFCWRS